MPQFKVVIGVATVQDDQMVVQPANGNTDNQLEVAVDATDASEALDIVQQNLQQLLSQPPT